MNKKRATSATIEDESGNGNNSTLVQSNCGKGDGTAYAKGNTENIYNSSDFIGALIWKNDSTASNSYSAIAGKYRPADKGFLIWQKDFDTITIYVSPNGSDFESFDISVARDTWHKLYFHFKDGIFSYSLDGLSYSHTFTTSTVFSPATTYISVFANGDGNYPFVGDIAYFRLGNAEFNLAEGGLSDTLYNTGTAGGNAVLQGATLSDFWSETQDLHHYNFLNGFDLWENGTAGEEIRIPIGKNVTTSGYSYSGTYQAGKWHNNAETKIQLPSSLKTVADGDITNPLVYSDFELDFNNAHTGFSNREDKKHKYLLFYNRVLTTAEQKKIQKCLKWKNSDNLLTDEDGNLLTDENGLYLEEE